MRRGEVWWHEPPEEKVRPVVILTRDEAIGRLNKLVVAPSTGTIQGIPTEVQVSREEGMPHDSAISLDNVALARKSHLTELITGLGPEKMDEVCRALARATACG
ncbi:MAG: type II toxin-antitoxin system PemK/MazF family toxin [Chloroflexota bacterium]